MIKLRLRGSSTMGGQLLVPLKAAPAVKALFDADGEEEHSDAACPPPPPRSLIFIQEQGITEGRKGRELGQLERWDEAQSCFLLAAKADADAAHIYYEMISQILLEKDEVFKAVQFAQRAAGAKDYIYGHWTLARCLRQFGEVQRARRAYTKALALADKADDRDSIAEEIREVDELIVALKTPKPGRNCSYNDRWVGAVNFYELADDVPPHIVPQWRKGKQLCCKPND